MKVTLNTIIVSYICLHLWLNELGLIRYWPLLVQSQNSENGNFSSKHQIINQTRTKIAIFFLYRSLCPSILGHEVRYWLRNISIYMTIISWPRSSLFNITCILRTICKVDSEIQNSAMVWLAVTVLTTVCQVSRLARNFHLEVLIKCFYFAERFEIQDGCLGLCLAETWFLLQNFCMPTHQNISESEGGFSEVLVPFSQQS